VMGDGENKTTSPITVSAANNHPITTSGASNHPSPLTHHPTFMV
jgi:hypothetical protein